jgi:signal transduction histidine kinase
MLGHDIRQPLTLILGYTQSVLDFWEGDCPDLPRSRLLKAIAAARRLDALIADVLTLARVDSGTIECRTTRTVLADVLPEVLAEVLDETVPDHDVQVHGDAGAAVLVDPWHLRQIVQNLLDNAVKYGRPPFEVAVQAGPEHVTMSVRDHGDGVADDVAGRLFERFARGGAAVVTGSPGSGLGLYLVRRLVEANGGTVEHVPAQGGACLQITLPRG